MAGHPYWRCNKFLLKQTNQETTRFSDSPTKLLTITRCLNSTLAQGYISEQQPPTLIQLVLSYQYLRAKTIASSTRAFLDRRMIIPVTNSTKLLQSPLTLRSISTWAQTSLSYTISALKSKKAKSMTQWQGKSSSLRESLQWETFLPLVALN